MAEITDHTARPGPDYWNWRCLTCGENVSNHISIPRYLWNRFLGR